MNAMVIYESMYGNTRAVAEAVADGLGAAAVLPVGDAPRHPQGVDLLVVGGPTHIHGLTTSRSRVAAVEAVRENAAAHLEPGATEGLGLRGWLRGLSAGAGARVATFDTRMDKSPWFTGAASRGIAKRLHHRGYEIVAMESFLVEGSEGPLAEGELDRARAWGLELVESFNVAASEVTR